MDNQDNSTASRKSQAIRLPNVTANTVKASPSSTTNKNSSSSSTHTNTSSSRTTNSTSNNKDASSRSQSTRSNNSSALEAVAATLDTTKTENPSVTTSKASTRVTSSSSSSSSSAARGGRTTSSSSRIKRREYNSEEDENDDQGSIERENDDTNMVTDNNNGSNNDYTNSMWPVHMQSSLSPISLPFRSANSSSLSSHTLMQQHLLGQHHVSEDEEKSSSSNRRKNTAQRARAISASSTLSTNSHDSGSSKGYGTSFHNPVYADTMEAFFTNNSPSSSSSSSTVLSNTSSPMNNRALKQGNLLHVTLPGTLPFHLAPTTFSASGNDANTMTNKTSTTLPSLDEDNNSTDPNEAFQARLNMIPEGTIGKLRIYSSGKTQMLIDNLQFDVSAGVNRLQYEHFVSVIDKQSMNINDKDTRNKKSTAYVMNDEDDDENDAYGHGRKKKDNEDNNNGPVPTEFVILGNVASTLLVSPDLENMEQKLPTSIGNYSTVTSTSESKPNLVELFWSTPIATTNSSNSNRRSRTNSMISVDNEITYEEHASTTRNTSSSVVRKGNSGNR